MIEDLVFLFLSVRETKPPKGDTRFAGTFLFPKNKKNMSIRHAKNLGISKWFNIWAVIVDRITLIYNINGGLFLILLFKSSNLALKKRTGEAGLERKRQVFL